MDTHLNSFNYMEYKSTHWFLVFKLFSIHFYIKYIKNDTLQSIWGEDITLSFHFFGYPMISIYMGTLWYHAFVLDLLFLLYVLKNT
jgi:hypothetical protein